MARVAKRRQNYQARNPGATQASQEKQDDRVSQGTPPGGNHEYADVNPDTHAHDAHDKDDNADCAENNNSDIAAATNGDDRPGLHVHEGQTGDQLPEDVDGDKKEGQAGDQPHEDDADVSTPNIDAPDVVVEEDNNGDERAMPVGQAGDQPPEKVDDDKKEGQGGVQSPEFDADVSNPSIDAPDIIDENDNNDGDRAVLLAPNISPQFNSKDLYKVLGVPMNATE
jgi:hypothetical protein